MDRLAKKREQVWESLEGGEPWGRQEGLFVRQAMTPSPNCIGPATDALELVRLFHAKQFRHLLVTHEGQLVGVISDRDVIRCLGPDPAPRRESLKQISAVEIMSTDLVTVGPETPLEDAVVLMLEEGISCLPVVCDGRLVGILTNTDLHVVLQLFLQTIRQARLVEPAPADVFDRRS